MSNYRWLAAALPPLPQVLIRHVLNVSQPSESLVPVLPPLIQPTGLVVLVAFCDISTTISPQMSALVQLPPIQSPNCSVLCPAHPSRRPGHPYSSSSPTFNTSSFIASTTSAHSQSGGTVSFSASASVNGSMSTVASVNGPMSTVASVNGSLSTVASVISQSVTTSNSMSNQSTSDAPSTSSVNSLASSTRTTTSTASLLMSSPPAIVTTFSSTVNHSVAPSAVAVLTHKTNKGAIAGGVVGGCLAFLALLGVLFLLLRPRRPSARVAPSAEFMSGRVVPISPDFMTRQAQLPLVARQPSLEDEQPPPSFTPGSYTDPIYEKVLSAKAQRQEYEAYDRVEQPMVRWDKAEKSLLIE